MDEDFKRYLKVATELKKELRQPILHIVGVDRLIAQYGMDDTVKMLNLSATMTRENGSLGILLLKPGYPREDCSGAWSFTSLRVETENTVAFRRDGRFEGLFASQTYPHSLKTESKEREGQLEL